MLISECSFELIIHIVKYVCMQITVCVYVWVCVSWPICDVVIQTVCYIVSCVCLCVVCLCIVCVCVLCVYQLCVLCVFVLPGTSGRLHSTYHISLVKFARQGERGRLL